MSSIIRDSDGNLLPIGVGAWEKTDFQKVEVLIEEYNTRRTSGGTMGWIDYNNSQPAVDMVAETWTNVPNDGAGPFTNRAYAPGGINELLDVSTGMIDPRELSLGDIMFIRNDFTITPSINNSALEFRYTLGSGANAYTLEKSIARMDRGSGIPYRFALRVDNIYMGDENTRNNMIGVQVKCSADATLLNAGSVIEVIKRGSVET
ncbi:MAG: hypothetical protein MJH10_11065 [Epibacterium sp.]|nr:hypothetical protein [Epibacterium sp.]NQX74085.1 hypothetical protein [Epibacterium sp.]